jgi:hypothetical protein
MELEKLEDVAIIAHLYFVDNELDARLNWDPRSTC